MKISSRCRYGIASMISIASSNNVNEQVTILSISEKLGISKIYLEQVFSLLKRSGLVISIKGSQGGYKLSKSPEDITAYDIIQAIETSLFEKTERSVSDSVIEIDNVMGELIFERLDIAIYEKLSKVTLKDLALEVKNQTKRDNTMFYI